MPQMMPLNWFFLMILIIMSFFMFMSISYPVFMVTYNFFKNSVFSSNFYFLVNYSIMIKSKSKLKKCKKNYCSIKFFRIKKHIKIKKFHNLNFNNLYKSINEI